MALITTSTPNLIGGVSMQPSALRTANQAEEQENAMANIIEGLKKRTNTEHIGTLTGAPTGTSFWHTIYRDSTEKYSVAISDDDLRVFDIANGGAVENVYDINGDIAVAADFSYLSMTATSDIEAITLADYTLVLNKSVQPKMKSATTATRKPEALVFVKAGNYSTEYSVEYVREGDSGKVTYTTKSASSATNADDIQTSHIAAALHHGLSVGTSTSAYPGLGFSGTVPMVGFSFAIEGSSVWLQRTDTTDFTIKASDSVASTNLGVLKEEVQSFVDLPVTAPNGFMTKIDGLPEEGAKNTAAYHVAFRTTSNKTTGAPGVAAFEEGVWEETVAPGIEYQIDPATMPHALIRLANGKFLWTALDGATTSGGLVSPDFTVPTWGDRVAGDETTNGRPPWLAKSGSGGDGGPIRGMSFFADRLVLLSGEDITLSESGQYFSWFRTTVTSLLDTARISVTAAHNRVNLLNFAIPMREQLVVFSEFSQFALRGSSDGTLTPTNIWVTAATDYEVSAAVEPVASKRSMFAAAPRGTATLVRELFDSGSTARPQFEAVEVTSQAPTYIQGTVVKMAVSTIEDTLVVLSDNGGVKDRLYIFRYMINGDERIQSAWSKFIFANCDILSVDWIDQDLYLIVKRGTQVSLERINFEAFLKDTGSTFRILLDRRVSLSSGVYTAGTNTTAFTVPYTVESTATMQVVTRASGATKEGQQLTVTASTGTTVTVSGDHSSTPVWVGEKYQMRYVFSPPNLRSSYGRNASRPVVSSASYRLRYGTILFEDSGYFKVAVTPTNQVAFNYPMTGRLLSASNNLIGTAGIATGHFKFPLMADYQAVTIEVINDSPLPSRLISAEWESQYHTRNSRY